MSLMRPRAHWKPPEEPLLDRSIEPLAIKPEQDLQAIYTLTGEIGRSMEGDNGHQDILLRTIDLSRWILAEPESLRTVAIFVKAYKSLLETILTQQAREGCTMDPAFEKWLDTQLDSYSEVFGIPMARSTGSRFQPPGSGSSLFPNARNFIITGGRFISHAPDTNLQVLREEVLQSVSDGNSAVLQNHNVRLQETLETILRVVCFNAIVLFY